MAQKVPFSYLCWFVRAEGAQKRWGDDSSSKGRAARPAAQAHQQRRLSGPCAQTGGRFAFPFPLSISFTSV